jgi:hypothetical protein
MSASADAYSKAWYGRQLDRLHREAPEDQKTTPEEALRHLPVESLAEVLDTTFQNYDTRASGFAERCLVEGELDIYHAFIKAHHDIIERFDMPAPNYYRDLASIIGKHFIRKKEKQLGITKSMVTTVRPAPKMPDSPLSDSPAPLSISSWINKVEDNTFEPNPHFGQDRPEPLTYTPEDSSPDASMNLQHKAPEPATHIPEVCFSGVPTNIAPQSLEQTAITSPPQRQRHPRKAKSESANQIPSKSSQRRATKKPGRGRKAANNGPTIAADTEADTHKQARGTKRSRAEDAVVSSYGAQVAQKRRKIAKPAAKSKR